MRYTTANVTKAKAMLVSRMSYLINLRLKYTTGRALADKIHMSANIISKLRNNVTKGISFEAVLEAAERLDVRYTLSMSHNGFGRRDVQLQMEDIESSRVRTLGQHQNPTLIGHRHIGSSR
jgi:transcriptional regulator with XRE-family HTH domain